MTVTIKQQLLVPTIGANSYADEIEKIVGLSNIVALWMLDEASGTVVIDRVNGRNGSYTGVTLADASTPWGGKAPRFDGANDVADVYSAALNSAWPKDEGSILLWGKQSAVGNWTDSAHGYLCHFLINTWDRLWHILDHSDNLGLSLRRTDTTSAKFVRDATNPAGWFQTGITWSVSTDEFKGFFNGAQTGSTQTGLAAIIGNLASNRCNIGADTNTPTSVFDGWLAAVLVSSTVLTPTQISNLYTLGGGS